MFKSKISTVTYIGDTIPSLNRVIFTVINQAGEIFPKILPKHWKTNRRDKVRCFVERTVSRNCYGCWLAQSISSNRGSPSVISCEIINSSYADFPLSVYRASYVGSDSNASVIYYGALRVYQGRPGRKYAVPFVEIIHWFFYRCCSTFER